MPDFRLEVLQLSRWVRDRAELAGEAAMSWFWFMNEAPLWREVPPSIDNEALEEAMQILNEFRTDVALSDLYRARLEAERVERGRQEALEEALAALAARDAALSERDAALSERDAALAREREEKEREREEKEREREEKERALAELAELKAKHGSS
jgi:hypothetical protein